MGISPEVGRLWRALSERRARFAWDALDLTTARTRFALPEALVVHDRNDKEVPFAEGEAIRDAWGIDLVETSGLGHQRVLRDPAVVRCIVDFVR